MEGVFLYDLCVTQPSFVTVLDMAATSSAIKRAEHVIDPLQVRDWLFSHRQLSHLT